MKDCTRKGMGKVNHCTPISNQMEDKMWKEGILGEDIPEKLLDTVLFLIGVNFSLRGERSTKGYVGLVVIVN